MANLNNPTFAVSLTPRVKVEETDNQTGEHFVMHEAVGQTLGGSGSYVGDDIVVSNNGGSSTSGWDEGTGTSVTSNGSSITQDTNTGVTFIKHLGTLVSDGTSSASADTVQVKLGSTILSELKNGEAILFVRPGASSSLTLASGTSNHVNVQVCSIDT